MPLINYNSVKDTAWIKNATRLWGIPLHPRGELSIDEYYLEVVGDMKQERIRMLSTFTHNIMVLFASCIFVRNFILSTGVVIRQRRSFPAWLCWIASLGGLVFATESVMLILDAGVNCRMLIWSTWYGMPWAQFFNSAILLQKAYLVLCRQKWILYIGIPMLFPQLLHGPIVMYYSYITTDPAGFCGMHFPPFVPMCWFGVIVTINTFFSIIFYRVAYKQYRIFGADAWRRLANDGIQYMCLVALCNILCCTFIVSEVAGNYTDIFFPIDWSISAALIVNHCQSIRNAKGFSNRPKTSHMLRISHIDTAGLTAQQIL
ncbi:hypothetical protein BDF19DRAFT_454303 [Syncephalis fuscata]|nr:hypothetical protein BDF19DRAFT_454303 [Syncephalis fuscata]